jgi:hypothetical protein
MMMIINNENSNGIEQLKIKFSNLETTYKEQIPVLHSQVKHNKVNDNIRFEVVKRILGELLSCSHSTKNKLNNECDCECKTNNKTNSIPLK